MQKHEVEDAQREARELTERAGRVKERVQFYAATLLFDGPVAVKKLA